MNNRKQKCLRQSALALFLGGTLAVGEAANIQDAAGKAVLGNPEVLAKWHQFKAAGHERDTAWSGFLPTLDILLGTAYQRQESPLFPTPAARSYNFQTARATLRQNLFDGLATTNETRRLEHAAMVRYYEMLDLSETAALEAARAYIDVLRYRRLVEYAQENYATHRLAYEKIRERAQTGVGRRVDLETAAGRLALAESNLLTETSNLHDVTARYQRIVGELPVTDLDTLPADFGRNLPASRNEGVSQGLEKSPQLKAALENIYSARRNVDVQKAGNSPRVDAYLEVEQGRNLNGYNTANGYRSNQTNTQTAGLTATWNLFRGNQDASRQGRTQEEVGQARQLREKVCRDVRQNLAMSYNDQLRLAEQLKFLDQHQLSTDKAREAFRRQFDLGQRTLLDVLDTENEYYTARRNYLNGEMDLEIAKARYLAASGGLLKALGLKPLDMSPLAPQPPAEEEPREICTAVAPAPREAGEARKAADRGPEQVILLPEAGGKVGEVVVASEGGSQARINQPYAAVQSLAGRLESRQLTEAEVRARYAHLLASPERFYTVQFSLGKTSLLPSSRPVLKAAVEDCLREPGTQVVLVGHADKSGNAGKNLKLSKARAEAVREKLVAGGVSPETIQASWEGDRRPLPETVGKAADQRNRRVEIRLK